MKNKKNAPNRDGYVYSTNPDFQLNDAHEETVTPAAEKQKLRIFLDKRNRSGKAVTLVEGFSGRQEDLVVLEKKLKAYCGTGGSVKDRVIIIQGDQRDKVLQWLQQSGYTNTKRI